MTAETFDLETLERRARAEIDAAEDLQALTEVRARYLGKKGSVAAMLRSIGDLEPSERGKAGQAANAAKQRIEAATASRRAKRWRSKYRRKRSPQRSVAKVSAMSPKYLFE